MALRISAPEQGEGGNSNVYYTPSVEVIQEFKVENNSFSAEYGNNGGTVLNIMMKQGGNQFHGSGWWFGQRDALDANDFFSNQAGIGKPPHVHDQYGGADLGPHQEEQDLLPLRFREAARHRLRPNGRQPCPRTCSAAETSRKPTRSMKTAIWRR